MVKVSTFVEEAHLGASVILNCVLLYAIRRFTRKSLGSYKQLPTIFASFDVFLTLLHVVIKPKVVIVDTVFGVTGIYNDRRITAFYTSCFTVPFALMNIHFLYRYWSIRRPHLIPLFSDNKFIVFIALFSIGEFVVWFLYSYYVLTGGGAEEGKTIVSEEYVRRFGGELKDGWLMMHHWENNQLNPQIFIAMISFDVIMFVSFTIATILGILIFYYAYNMQLKLFISLSAQTFVPLVFVYIPYFCVLNFPFFRLPVGIVDDACMLLTSCFPAWDAVIIIVLMKDYREGLIRMFIKKQTIPMGATVITTSVMPTVVSTVH